MIFFWLLSIFVKIDAAKCEVDMTYHFQDITKKQFRRQLTIPPHKQSLLHNTYMEGEILTLLLRRTVMDNR